SGYSSIGVPSLPKWRGGTVWGAPRAGVEEKNQQVPGKVPGLAKETPRGFPTPGGVGGRPRVGGGGWESGRPRPVIRAARSLPPSICDAAEEHSVVADYPARRDDARS